MIHTPMNYSIKSPVMSEGWMLPKTRMTPTKLQGGPEMPSAPCIVRTLPHMLTTTAHTTSALVPATFTKLSQR